MRFQEPSARPNAHPASANGLASRTVMVFSYDAFMCAEATRTFVTSYTRDRGRLRSLTFRSTVRTLPARAAFSFRAALRTDNHESACGIDRFAGIGVVAVRISPVAPADTRK